MRQRELSPAIDGWPDEAALTQATRREPDADAVVHEHLQPIGPLVGEQGRVVEEERCRTVPAAGGVVATRSTRRAIAAPGRVTEEGQEF